MLYKNSNKEKYLTFKEFHEAYKDQIIDTKDSTLNALLGNILINWLCELKFITRIIRTNESLGKLTKSSILILDNQLSKLMPVSTMPILTLPVKLPMICPPKKYLNKETSSVNEYGGFLLNNVQYTEPLVIDNNLLKNNTELETKNIVYEMVDNISSVPFSVNTDVLDFIITNNKKYNLYTDHADIHPLASKEKLKLKERKELDSFNSKKLLELEILNIANIFRSRLKFYIPVRLDYRGRIYCNAHYLNYQGIDLAKSLLQFAIGEKVYIKDSLSINYLKIFGANCFGNKIEKKSFNERIK